MGLAIMFAMMYRVVLRKGMYALPNFNSADLSSAHSYLQTSLKFRCDPGTKRAVSQQSTSRVKSTGLSPRSIMSRSNLWLHYVSRSTGTHLRIYQDKARERHPNWNQHSSSRDLGSTAVPCPTGSGGGGRVRRRVPYRDPSSRFVSVSSRNSSHMLNMRNAWSHSEVESCSELTWDDDLTRPYIDEIGNPPLPPRSVLRNAEG